MNVAVPSLQILRHTLRLHAVGLAGRTGCVRGCTALSPCVRLRVASWRIRQGLARGAGRRLSPSTGGGQRQFVTSAAIFDTDRRVLLFRNAPYPVDLW